MAEHAAFAPLPSSSFDPIRDASPPPDIPTTFDGSYDQALQRLIGGAVPQNELAPLIETIFLNKKAIDMADSLPENDVQIFIDAIDTVWHHALSPL